MPDWLSEHERRDLARECARTRPAELREHAARRRRSMQDYPDSAVRWAHGKSWFGRMLAWMFPRRSLVAEHVRLCQELDRLRQQLKALDRRPTHPESYCHRCDGTNICWSAPSPLWNAVMRGGSINGDEAYDGIVCPTCFAEIAEAGGIARLWRLSAEVVDVALEAVTPSGRVWDEQTWLWREQNDNTPTVSD